MVDQALTFFANIFIILKLSAFKIVAVNRMYICKPAYA
jgi:hypothetical protein